MEVDIMTETLELGPTPTDEACEQLGPNYDPAQAVKECRAFVAQLRRVFGPEPYGARLVVTSNPHDFGTYREVGVKFDGDIDGAADYAYKIEGQTPERWDEAAMFDLGLR
jgi:hypothetical protein